MAMAAPDQFSSSACNVGAALLSQLNWDLWQYLGNAQFHDYHYGWWHGIWWAAFPIAGIALIGICLQLKYRPRNAGKALIWTALVLQILIYIGTVIWWGPNQGRLHFIHERDGSLNPDYVIMVNSNWARVVLFILSFLLEFWICVKSFIGMPFIEKLA